MSAVPETFTPQQNRILAALRPGMQKRLFPHLKLEALPLGTILYESGHICRVVHFPIDSIVSLMYETESGSSVEIAKVGNEGLVGIAALMGGESTITRALVQSAGHAYSLPALRLQDAFNTDIEMRKLLLRYVQAMITGMAQTAVCNRHHSIEQRLCRLLLMSLDRLHGNQLNATQELIAYMLGVRRKGVTETAGKLRELGVIEFRRGRITVLDRSRLEKLSCECYAVPKTETDRQEAC